MFDFEATDRSAPASTGSDRRDSRPVKRLQGFLVFKRTFDLVGAFLILGLALPVGLVLLALNPFLNPGGLFYRQTRMGRDCRPFTALKFRSMLDGAASDRGAWDGIEHHRITAFGRFLRRTRLDELPQCWNVLCGDMSLIGPRPDYYDHAVEYVATVPGYRERHAVRPGVSGYAQTELGYAEGFEAVRRKVEADLHYIRNRSVRLDLWIAWRTIVVILRRQGS